MKSNLHKSILSIGIVCSGLLNAQTTVTGPSSSQTCYMTPVVPSTLTSIITAGDAVGNYTLSGLMDGLGAYDNGDGTFTVLMNHEAGNTSGAIRAHGQPGAFVSKLIINKTTLAVTSATDLIQNVNVWNGTAYTTYNASNTSSSAAFGRFCSADLPAVSAFFNSSTGKGTQERIFMNGEESGNEGRAFAHIATGPNAGTSYHLPFLPRLSYENAIASPFASDNTIVGCMDDSSPGQVYFYVGTKTNTGTEIDKAGLSNGNVYGVAVTGLLAESSSSIPAAGTTFSLVNLGNLSAVSGSSLNTISNAAGVTTFLRPEDGAWDPASPNDFYFVTTNSFSSPSRLWKLSFTSISTPTLGGTITAVLDGTEGQKMLDNLCVYNGAVYMQEDPGNQSHNAKTWKYDIATDALTLILQHDVNRFITGGSSFLTQDEESSGIIDLQSILGPGKFLIADQSHYSIPSPVLEGGQLLILTMPVTSSSVSEISNVLFFNVFPNPANNEINIAFNLGEAADVMIKITDVQGKQVFTSVFKKQAGENNIAVNTSELVSGIYFVELNNGTSATTKQIVISH